MSDSSFIPGCFCLPFEGSQYTTPMPSYSGFMHSWTFHRILTIDSMLEKISQVINQSDKQTQDVNMTEQKWLIGYVPVFPAFLPFALPPYPGGFWLSSFPWPTLWGAPCLAWMVLLGFCKGEGQVGCEQVFSSLHHTLNEWATFRKSTPCTPLFHQTSSSTFSKAIKKVKSKYFLKNELKMSHPGREYTRKQLLSLSSVSIWGGRFGVNLGETSMVAAREGTGLGMRGRF